MLDRENTRTPEQTKSSRSTKLTQSLFQIDWNEIFPLQFERELRGELKTFTIKHVEFSDVASFFDEHGSTIFHNINRGFHYLDQPTFKSQFYNRCMDHFGFYCDGILVGYASGNAQDWDTYYLRYHVVLPKYRGARIGDTLITKIFDVLRHHGVARVEAHTANNNVRQLIKFLELGFIPTGHVLSERWGALIALTYFTDRTRLETMQRQFFGDRDSSSKPLTTITQ